MILSSKSLGSRTLIQVEVPCSMAVAMEYPTPRYHLCILPSAKSLVVLGQDGKFLAVGTDTCDLCNDLVQHPTPVRSGRASVKGVACECGGFTSLDVESSEDRAGRVADRMSLCITDVATWTEVYLLTPWDFDSLVIVLISNCHR